MRGWDSKLSLADGFPHKCPEEPPICCISPVESAEPAALREGQMLEGQMLLLTSDLSAFF